MAFYTVVMDYAGGTYISQVRSRSVNSALVKWAHSLAVNEIDGLGPKGKEQLVEQMKVAEAVALAGLRNVWCSSASLRGKLALINVIRTDAE